jgi:hypothetical protein
MASRVVNQGLQTIAERASMTTPTFGRIQSMRVDDGTTGFAAGDTSCGITSNEQANALDSEPARTNQTMRHVMTLTTAQFNGQTVKRISLHNAAAGSVADSSTTLVAGIDGLSIGKLATFSLTISVDITYTTVVG